jgi:hypothetical protein
VKRPLEMGEAYRLTIFIHIQLWKVWNRELGADLGDDEDRVGFALILSDGRALVVENCFGESH